MKQLVYVALAVLTVVAGVLAYGLLHRPERVAPPPPLVVEKCDEAKRPLPPLRPELTAARLEVLPGSVPVKIDGAHPGATLRSGLHIIEAGDAKLQVRVEPFAEVVVEATAIGDATLLLVFGARCATCARPEAELDLKFNARAIGSVDALVRALGRGDWATAVQQMRSVPPDDRETPHVRRMFAAVYLLSGQPVVAREWIDGLPKGDVLRAALTAMDVREEKVGDRQLATASDRWNAVSERYQRLSDAFANDAGPQMTELSKKFNGYSDRFLAATTAKSTVECELVLHEATEAVEAAVASLRAMKTDCAWQKRVWSAL